jgi:hypothetical protein
MNYMIGKLEYTEYEVADIFASIESGGTSVDALLVVTGLELSLPAVRRMNAAIPKWRSALSVTVMRLEA